MPRESATCPGSCSPGEGLELRRSAQPAPRAPHPAASHPILPRNRSLDSTTPGVFACCPPARAALEAVQRVLSASSCPGTMTPALHLDTRPPGGPATTVLVFTRPRPSPGAGLQSLRGPARSPGPGTRVAAPWSRKQDTCGHTPTSSQEAGGHVSSPSQGRLTHSWSSPPGVRCQCSRGDSRCAVNLMERTQLLGEAEEVLLGVPVHLHQ